MASPDDSAVRVALWRALHLLDDPDPVFRDEVGLRLVDPTPDWRARPDMSAFTRPFRASIVARARFVEDLVAAERVTQYVILGAGLDTFAQRRRDLGVRVFEIDRTDPQAWKADRLAKLGLAAPTFVPVDFEREAWIDRLVAAGFEPTRPSVVSSLGVSMYLTRDAVIDTLRTVASLAKRTTFVMSFLLPLDRLDPETRPGVEAAARGARANGTPWRSFFDPEEIMGLAAGFGHVEHVSAEALTERFFAGRPDGLRPPARSEELLVARV